MYLQRVLATAISLFYLSSGVCAFLPPDAQTVFSSADISSGIKRGVLRRFSVANATDARTILAQAQASFEIACKSNSLTRDRFMIGMCGTRPLPMLMYITPQAHLSSPRIMSSPPHILIPTVQSCTTTRKYYSPLAPVLPHSPHGISLRSPTRPSTKTTAPLTRFTASCTTSRSHILLKSA
jgi:hypothetical protein